MSYNARRAALPNAAPSLSGLTIATWITTFLIPFVGFICAIILTAKGRTGHGVSAMVVSALWLLILVAAISHGSG